MRLAFIDDSTQTTSRRKGLGELIAIGGVIVPGGEVAGYAAELTAIRADLGVPADAELKWKPPRGSFLGGADRDLIGGLRQRMLQAAVDRGFCSVVVVWDRGRVTWDRPRIGQEILKYLYERVSMCLASADGGAGDVGIMIADEPGGGPRDQRQWLARTLELTERGRAYIRPARVVLPIVTAPSHHVPHLQLADLVVGATTAAVAGHPAGLPLAPLLRELAHKNHRGYAGGAGIKLFPDGLSNLYHWVLVSPCSGRSAAGQAASCQPGRGPTVTTTACRRSPHRRCVDSSATSARLGSST